nr:hypothetical protein [Rhizobium mesosinicum]
MSLKLISGMMKSSGEEALLLMEAAGTEQIVLVSKEALMAVAEPPRCDESRLQENIDVFSKIADAKFAAGSAEPDGRIRITAADIGAWLNS